MKTLVRACPICQAQLGRVLHTQRFAVPDEFAMADAFDVVACADCGFVFADTTTTQAALDVVYEEHSKYADTGLYANGTEDDAGAEAPISDAPWDLDRLRGTAAYLATAVTDHGARVLDAGCATGSLLAFLGEEGFTDLVGLDPSPVATATARGHPGVTAVTGSFITPPPGLGQFDAIALSHVLEHLADVRAAVTSLAALLRPGGLAYVEVPDAERYGDHLVAPYHDINTEHINHFSLALLDRLMVEHGFAPVDLGRKVVMCSPRHTYPAAYGLWQKRPQAAPMPEPAGYDEDLVAAFERYVADSGRLLAEIDVELADAVRAEAAVIVWGAGQLAMKLLRDSVLARAPVVAIVDSSPQKQGLHLAGVPVVAPSAVASVDAPIVVTSIHHEASIVSTIDATLGAGRRVVLLSDPTARRSHQR